MIEIDGSFDPTAVNDLIYELRNAGAEAIAVDDIRITAGSVAVLGTRAIEIDGVPLGRRFTVRAIGSPDGLRSAIERPGGILTPARAVDQRALHRRRGGPTSIVPGNASAICTPQVAGRGRVACAADSTPLSGRCRERPDRTRPRRRRSAVAPTTPTSASSSAENEGLTVKNGALEAADLERQRRLRRARPASTARGASARARCSSPTRPSA